MKIKIKSKPIKIKMIGVKLDEDTFKKIKDIADKNNVSLGEVIRQILEKTL